MKITNRITITENEIRSLVSDRLSELGFSPYEVQFEFRNGNLVADCYTNIREDVEIKAPSQIYRGITNAT